jgi:hypothetical protein
MWAVHLLLIYGSQSSLCAFNSVEDGSGRDTTIIAIIQFATVVCIATVGFSAVRARQVHASIARADPPPEQTRFIMTMMRVLAALSILAMFYAAMGSVILPVCDQLR